MSFGFGGPRFRSFDAVNFLQCLEIAARGCWFLYQHRYEIMSFLKRNHKVISVLFVTSFAGVLAASFAVGSFETLLGMVRMHIAMSVMVAIAATGFGAFTVWGAKEARQEWRRRPEPTPVGSD